MKKIYTRNEIQRMATEKAMEILQENKDMMFTNTSYGLSKGECLLGLANGYNSFSLSKEIYIMLERKGTWCEGIYDLAVYKKNNGEYELVEVIGRFYEIRNIEGRDVYVTDKEAYDKHQERLLRRYNRKDIHWNIEVGTALNKKIKDRIEKATNKKIKKQDFIVRKQAEGYVIQYDYRNVRKSLYL